MRNSTKIKQTLMLFDLHLSMDEDEWITVKMIHKTMNKEHRVKGKTISQIANQVHRIFKIELKESSTNPFHTRTTPPADA